jgi:hypothetical protein
MKKLAFLAAALFATTALAGEYHTYTTLVCSDCHTMHASRTHSFGTNAQDNTDTSAYGLGATGVLATGNDALLKGSDLNRTCLTCHDGDTTIPDVLNSNSGAFPRSAGALNATFASDANYPAFTGHTIGTGATPPGYAGAGLVIASGPQGQIKSYTWTPGTTTLGCNGCHSVHGAVSYRNLGSTGPSYSIVSSGTAIDPTVDVTEFGGKNYNQGGIFYGQATGGLNYKMNLLCEKCHGNFHSSSGVLKAEGTGTVFQRHPTDGVGFTSGGLVTIQASSHGGFKNLLGAQSATLGNSTNVKVIFKGAANKTSDGRAVPGTSEMTIGCLTCHKAHGNQNSYGLIFYGDAAGSAVSATNALATTATYSPVADTTEEGNGVHNVRQLCIQCHSPGRTDVNVVNYK